MHKKYHFFPALIIGLLLSAGCGAPSSPAKDGSYITLAEAKTTVLENAGLSEENVVFVRLYLDSDSDAAKYDIEFVSETTEYTYTVNAITGEILSLNCEMGEYDLASISRGNSSNDTAQNDGQSGSIPPDNAQTGGPQSGSPQADSSQSGTSQPDAAQSGASQPAAQSDGTLSGGAQSGGSPSGTPQSGSNRNEADSQYIGRDAAQQAALAHAGFDADSVRIAHVHLEYDDGCWQYDVEFHKDNTEYDYDIDAITGAVLSCHHEAHDSHHHSDHHDAAGSANLITAETAKQYALNYAGIAEADAQGLKTELDYDDERAEYEVEWYVGRTEYACDVDAVTGEIISFEKELD